MTEQELKDRKSLLESSLERIKEEYHKMVGAIADCEFWLEKLVKDTVSEVKEEDKNTTVDEAINAEAEEVK